jgi:hypothetical protein
LFFKSITANNIARTLLSRETPTRAGRPISSTTVRKLFAFVKQLDECNDDPERVIALCMEEGIPVIETPDYDPLAHCDDAGRHDWCLFVLFLCCSRGWHIRGATHHVEWVGRRKFKDTSEWFGEEGTKFRKQWGLREPGAGFLDLWSAFRAEHQSLQLLEIEQQLNPYWDLPEPAIKSARRARKRAP